MKSGASRVTQAPLAGCVQHDASPKTEIIGPFNCRSFQVKDLHRM